MAGGIFISYRREDSRHAAGRLVDRLGKTFSVEQLFMDVDNIDIGVDFLDVLVAKVAACDVMLVVVGPQWINARDENGNRRLSDPRDYVRIEIEQALARDIRVVPIVVDGAIMPRAEELPPSLQPLIRRQAAAISHEKFGADVERIVEMIERIVPARRSVRLPPEREVVPPVAHLVTYSLIMTVAAEIGPLRYAYYAPDIPRDKKIEARDAMLFPASEEMLVLFESSSPLEDHFKVFLALSASRLFYWRRSKMMWSTDVVVVRETVSWRHIVSHHVGRRWLSRNLQIGSKVFEFGNKADVVGPKAFLSKLKAKARGQGIALS